MRKLAEYGRELYSAPKIIVWGNPDELKYKDFKVSTIGYKNRKISILVITDGEGKVVYEYPNNTANSHYTEQNSNKTKNATTEKTNKTDKLITEAQRKRLFALGNGNNDLVKQVIGKYNYTKTEEIKMSDYENICNEIQKVN